MSFFKKIVRPLLFRMDAESAHEFAMRAMLSGLGTAQARKIAKRRLNVNFDKGLERFGLLFRNPLGVAAGFDKNAKAVEQLDSLGFGHVEVGTVTLRPQLGNPKPRIFRLPEDNALINRLGFNNEGASSAIKRLSVFQRQCIVGLNIGKNKDVPNEEAGENYLASFEIVHPAADYVSINISSPNTPNLRDLQQTRSLDDLLSAIQNKNKELGIKPLLVKIAPDLENDQVKDIVDVCLHHKVAGIIATNTTISREGLTSSLKNETGGLSGKPLSERSNQIISLIYRHTNGNLPIIGVGGIFSPDDAFNKITAGASLIQAYTGFIYGGPSFAKTINSGLLELLESNGFSGLNEAIGSRAS